MTKRIRLLAAVVVSGLSFANQSQAQTKTFEILNLNVSQGDVIIVKAEESFYGEDLGIYAFDKIWPYNKDKFAFVGVDYNTRSDFYTLYHVNTKTGERVDDFDQEIVVRTRYFPVVRLKRNGSSTVSQKRFQERELIKAVFDFNSSEDHIEGVFRYPLEKIEVSINGQFGTQRIYKNGYISSHIGVDLRTKEKNRDKGSKSVLAVNSGRVVLTGKFSIEGNMIIIDHGQKIFSVYMHLSKIMVKPGQVVENGQKIAIAGATGRGTGPHLHFAMKINNAVIDPLAFIETFNLVFSMSR